MKKICLIITLILILSTLVSCGNKENTHDDIINNEESEIVFQGEYISNGGSSLTISQSGERFDVKIDIVRLTRIEDGVGNIISKDRIDFSATDAQGNLIFGEIYWKNSNEVSVEFTKSSWEYLPSGTIFNFFKN